MQQVKFFVPDYLYQFYRQVGQRAGGVSAEQVMGEVLFKLAGELALQSIDKKDQQEQR